MELEKCNKDNGLAPEMQHKEGLGIRLFKSLSRKNVNSPKLTSYQNKENAKNYGNQNSMTPLKNQSK